MTSAKITRCNHYFHGVCLRKWLYVQDRCPFCHEIIMNQDNNTNGNASPALGDEAIENVDQWKVPADELNARATIGKWVRVCVCVCASEH